MSKFPTRIDDDTDLPPVNDNLTETGAAAVNATRDAIFNIENEIGIGASGTMGSVAARLAVSIQPDGYIKSSILTTLGLVTLPITNDQIAENAGIPESKLHLNFRTQDLYNYTRSFVQNVNSVSSWIALTGIKLEPHITGFLYRHEMDQIDVSSDGNDYLKNKFGILRNNAQSYALVKDINAELLAHQFADGSSATGNLPIITNNGSVYGSDYAHTASGIFLNPSRFSSVPQTIEDLQRFAEFIDSSSIFVYGTRIQNLYSNGISKASRSAKLDADGYGQPVISPTTAITYLLNIGTSSSPVDSITNGDDIIEFTPPTDQITSNSFDEKFALVRVGDIARVNYGAVEVKFIIKEKKYYQNAGIKKYVIRIAGKNLYYTTNAQVRIDKPLFNTNKDGVLAVAAANNGANSLITPSLIVGSPRGAQALGLGFNPDQFDSSHYLLYLALYPTGVPEDGYKILPGIDVTGNKGATPGKYTLDSIVEATNNAFRAVGYNYRFIAFQHNGEFGIMLADSYNNASFSIFNAVVDANGFYDSLGTSINFPNNVVGIFTSLNLTAPDPLGFGSNGAAIASPPFMATYGSAEAAVNPTKLFTPLKRNNYYVNGTEREKLILEVGQALDTYGDGYWIGHIIAPQNIYPGPFPAGRVETTYRIAQNLQTSGLKIGKTIVVQSIGSGTISDFGRFLIQGISFGCGTDQFTDITVYDAVHGTSISPSPVLGVDGYVGLYFNSDSVSFNTESATDTVAVSPFKRHFEVYIDEVGSTFTHERGRINASSSTITVNGSINLHTFSELSKLDIIKISPKLRGYQFGSVNKISLFINSFDTSSGVYDGYFCSYDDQANIISKKGPNITGKKGQVTRFYDETNIDYIDIIFDVNVGVSTFSNEVIDFQLFPTLSLDDEIMLIATCQLNDGSNTVTKLRDERQFGNVSEKELSTSALNFMALPERLLHANGVLRGFDLEDTGSSPNPNAGQIYMTGGLALINGKFVQVNDQTIVIPLVKELIGTLFNINWALCVNDRGEYQPIPLRDFDATLGTPNDDSRIVKVFNPLNGQIYNLDSVLFSDLINNRKDLTILYIVASTVVLGSGSNPPTITLSKTDARKYVNDVDTNLPLRLTVGNAQGNFKNPESIFNWIKYNNTYNSKAVVKGADLTTGVINTSLILDFNSTAVIDGENQATLTMNGPVILGSNLTLQNLNITFNNTVALSASVQNLLLDNCNIVINMPNNLTPLATPTDGYTIFDFVNSDNILIRDCNISVTYNGDISGGTVFRLTNTTNFVFNNNSFNIDFRPISAPVNITPGDVFKLVNSTGAIITNSDFTGNFNKFIYNVNSNALSLTNLTVTSTYNPNAGVSPDIISGVTYATGSLVNSGQGYIYSNITSRLDDVKIDNVIFNYSPSTQSAGNDRYSFINFELSSNTSILSNLVINNCRFNNTNVNGASTDDIRAAIAILNIAPASLATQQQPILVNAKISNNICNRNQMIIMTSKTQFSGTNSMEYPGLAAQNCSISDNICGTIGYWVSSGAKVVNTPPNVNSLSDKASGLLISNNTCHFITNLDERGAYYRVSKILAGTTSNVCRYPSGYVTIRNNKCNWIHVSVAYEEDSALQIIDNYLHAYAQSYLDQYGTAVAGNLYAIYVDSNIFSSNTTTEPGLGSDASCVIRGNTTGTGYWLQTTLTTLSYKYTTGFIYSKSSCIIDGNTLKGINTSGTAGNLILVSGLHSIITHNKIFRKTADVSSYVAFADLNTPAWNGSTSTGIITDNFFDSPFINASLSESVIGLPSTVTNRWVFERNKNQTGYAIIPFTNQAFFGSVWGPATGPVAQSSSLSISPMNDGSGLTGAYKSQYTMIIDNATAAFRFWGGQDNIEKYLPNNVRVIQLRAGLRPFGTTVQFSTATPNTSSYFYLNIFRVDSNAAYYDTSQFASVNAVDAFIPEMASPVFSVVTGGQINSTYSNIPFLINLENYTNPVSGTNYGDISYNYITGRGRGISISSDWRWQRTNNNEITLSPIQVKYRW